MQRCGPALLAVTAVLAIEVHRRAEFVPAGYLVVVVAALVALSTAHRWRRPGPRWGQRTFALAVVVVCIPVPWLTVRDDRTGLAWQLDGRLDVAGRTVDPPGTYLWLTTGRPIVIAELLRGTPAQPGGNLAARTRPSATPRLSEPSAAAAGLRAAGLPVTALVTVELSDPTWPGLPAVVQVASAAGREVRTAADWAGLAPHLRAGDVIVGRDGTRVTMDGPELPYRRTVVVEHPDVEVVVGGPLARTPIGRWWRSQSTGASHGLMVALVVYADASGLALPEQLTVAGTGTVAFDGTVGPVGGVRAKARAARRAGADLLLLPAAQVALLDDLDLAPMRVVGVDQLADAIAAVAALSRSGGG